MLVCSLFLVLFGVIKIVTDFFCLFTKQMLVCSLKTPFKFQMLPFYHVTGEASKHLNSKFMLCIFISTDSFTATCFFLKEKGSLVAVRNKFRTQDFFEFAACTFFFLLS